MNKEREALLYLEGYFEAVYLTINPDKALVINTERANDLLNIIKNALEKGEKCPTT